MDRRKVRLQSYQAMLQHSATVAPGGSVPSLRPQPKAAPAVVPQPKVEAKAAKVEDVGDSSEMRLYHMWYTGYQVTRFMRLSMCVGMFPKKLVPEE